MIDIRQGDCVELMRAMPANSVDSIVTDPPYELGFMGKSWDSTGIANSVRMWDEALRVLKPGGYLLSFGGSRTYHRMACAIEDAGFEIRDQIMWVYGSGFPKSLDVSKAIDKGQGQNRQRQLQFVNWMRTTGLKQQEINTIIGKADVGSHYLRLDQPAIATADLFDKLRPYLPEVPEEIERLVAERTGIEWIEYKNRKVIGSKMSAIANKDEGPRHTIGASHAVEVDITAPFTPEAQQWQGWGTALKPAFEPIVVARKPIEGTVANNVLKWGTGGLNIDGSRIGTQTVGWLGAGRSGDSATAGASQEGQKGGYNYGDGQVRPVQGRWPANFIHDGSDEVLELFPETKSPATYTRKSDGFGVGSYVIGEPAGTKSLNFGDSGSAARFFYCAKTSKKDRNEGLHNLLGKETGDKGNGLARTCIICGASTLQGCDCPDRTYVNPTRANHHPTVKPTDLMRYLIRLVTPPNGTVLDPFIGSGSTGKAAVLEGFNFIGCELDPDYIAIANARISHAVRQQEGKLL